MITTKLVALWRPVGVFLIVLAAFAVGTGLYVASKALWSLLLVVWPLLVAGMAAVLLLGAWWVWWQLPKRQVDQLRAAGTDAKAVADVEDNIRKTVGQILVGIAAALIASLFTFMQFTQQQRLLKQQQEVAHDSAINNQVTKGFELLGNSNRDLLQRLGGIYALEGAMNTSTQYYQPILEVLCALIRDTAQSEAVKGPPATDVQAALTVIGRRSILNREVQPDLRGARIAGADLSDANLRGANLASSDLSGANLNGANLTGAFLGAGGRLGPAVQVYLSRIGVNVTPTNLSGASLIHANLAGADVGYVILRGADLRTATLRNAFLTGSDLSEADLKGADLSGADLNGANLTGADLADSSHAYFRYTYGNIRPPTDKFAISDSNLKSADLSAASLIGTTLTRANLLGATGLTQAQLDEACGTDVKLDPGLTIKPCGPPPAPKQP